MGFFDTHKPRNLPRFERNELGLGTILGTGGFCMVHEIIAMRLLTTPTRTGEDTQESRGNISLEAAYNNNENSGCIRTVTDDDMEVDDVFDDSNDEMEIFDEESARTFMLRNCMRQGYGGVASARYAIKRLKTTLMGNMVTKGIDDLAVEAKFLAVVQHPNIIKMRAVSEVEPNDGSFFIVLDRLYGTLEHRIYNEWAEVERKFGSLGGGIFSCCSKMDSVNAEIRNLWVERLLAGYDLSSAFRYLHKNKIVYRDIKPENVGFDCRGDVKLFDFGFARELLPSDKVKGTELYKLTGLTGSIRYMAPEVALRKPYNLTCDVYSFGLLLFEIIALKPPFSIEDVRDHIQLVIKGGQRPKPKSFWPMLLSNLMKECWSENTQARPTFEQIASTLRGQAAVWQDNPGSEIMNRTNVMLNKSNASMTRDEL